MKVQSYDGTIERQVVTAAAVNNEVLSKLASYWGRGLFYSRAANIIGDTCVNYYKKYGKPPGKSLLNLLTVQLEATLHDRASIQAVSELAQSLDLSEQPQNDKYLLDLTAKHIEAVQLRKISEGISAHLDSDDLQKARECCTGFSPPQLNNKRGLEVFTDEAAVRSLFTGQRNEPIITYPGDLGAFFGRSLYRSAFVSVIAGEKTGKTTILMDMAYRAILARHRVVFFGVGDMTEDEMLEKVITRAAGRPFHADWLNYPVSLKTGKVDEPPILKTEERRYLNKMTEEEAITVCQKMQLQRIKSKNSYLRIYFYPAGTCTVSMISSEIKSLQRSGWVPSVVIVDYADILAPPEGVFISNTRDAINLNWQQLRALSQEHYALTLTATQAPARSYGKLRIGKGDFSDDKRKSAHITGEFGVTLHENKENDNKLFYFNWKNRRGERSNSLRGVWVAPCMEIANPAVLSCF